MPSVVTIVLVFRDFALFPVINSADFVVFAEVVCGAIAGVVTGIVVAFVFVVSTVVAFVVMCKVAMVFVVVVVSQIVVVVVFGNIKIPKIYLVQTYTKHQIWHK